MKKNQTTYICLLLLSFANFRAIASNTPQMATANLTSAVEKDLKGTLHIHETKKGINITADVTGLKPGAVHGFHVHEKGECVGPDFKSAGDHLNPTKHNHGGPAAQVKHLGDLGNIVANDKGVARTEVFIPAEKGISISSFIGKSVVIHAKADDQASQPSGNSGDRIACAVIK